MFGWGDIEYQLPWARWLVLLAIPVYLLARRPAGYVAFSALALLPARDWSWRVRLAWVPDAALALAVAALAFAFAGPRTPARDARIEREGIAIMMVVDTSGSMQALDMMGDRKEIYTRLDAVKDVFRAFVRGDRRGGLRGRLDDQIGLVSFARYADTRCPVTLNHGSLLTILDDVEIVTERAEDGTAIGDGLGLALERLREAKASSRVAILLTDGVNNAGVESPQGAADLAASLGIKVYTIGAGQTGYAPVAVQDPRTGKLVLDREYFRLDEDTLRKIAERTGGQYFHASTAGGLAQVYREIDRLERTEISERRLQRYDEHYQWPLAFALILAALAWLARGTAFRRLPC